MPEAGRGADLVNTAFASLVKQGLLGSGHYPRRLRRDTFPGVAVLCYHGICVDSAADLRMSFGDPIYPPQTSDPTDEDYAQLTAELKARVVEMWDELHGKQP